MSKKEIYRRLKPIGEAGKRGDEKFKVLARPHERRRVIDKTVNLGVSQGFQVTIRATDEHGKPIDVTRIWATINGKNHDYRRPSRGKGQYGDFGPYTVDYKPPSTGVSKLKVQSFDDNPVIMYYSVKQVS